MNRKGVIYNQKQGNKPKHREVNKMKHGYRYKKPTYSAEQYKYWEEGVDKLREFAKAHSSETEKIYEVHGFYIVCIQRKYDKCMDKENEYGIQVWMSEDRKNPEDCVENEWFNNPKEANLAFISYKNYL